MQSILLYQTLNTNTSHSSLVQKKTLIEVINKFNNLSQQNTDINMLCEYNNFSTLKNEYLFILIVEYYRVEEKQIFFTYENEINNNFDEIYEKLKKIECIEFLDDGTLNIDLDKMPNKLQNIIIKYINNL